MSSAEVRARLARLLDALADEDVALALEIGEELLLELEGAD